MGMHAACSRGMIMATCMAQLHMQVMTGLCSERQMRCMQAGVCRANLSVQSGVTPLWKPPCYCLKCGVLDTSALPCARTPTNASIGKE